jgi:hypothetical protein
LAHIYKVKEEGNRFTEYLYSRSYIA